MGPQWYRAMDDEEYESMRRVAYFQFFRVVAIFGTLVGATMASVFGFFAVTVMRAVTASTLTLLVAGYEIPILAAAQLVFAAEVIRKLAMIIVMEEPEIRRIER